MINGLQKVHATIGEGGCFQLASMDIGREVAGAGLRDAALVFQNCQLQSCRHFDGTMGPVIDDTCYVHAPEQMMFLATGRRWKYRKEGLAYECQPGEWDLIRFVWTQELTGKKIEHGHFVRGDGRAILDNGRGHVRFDPYGNSLTVANGRAVSKRIYSLAV